MKRILGLSFVCLLFAAPSFGETPKPAAPPAATPPAAAAPAFACEGQIAILYHSKIKQGGSMDGFIEAAKAQEAWYRAQGMTGNRIVVAKVVVTDKATRQQSYAADEVFNLHINPPTHDRYQDHTGPKPDYIEKFKANATVIDKKTICLPKF